MSNYTFDENDISRFNLIKVNEAIDKCRLELKQQIAPITKDELEAILIKLEDTRNYIKDMRYEKSL